MIPHLRVILCLTLLCVTLDAARGDLPEASSLTEAQLTELLGPLREPVRIIELPAGFQFNYLDVKAEVLRGQPELLLFGSVRKGNAWAFIVYLWPEIALTALAVGLLLVLWRVIRVVRRPQPPNEPICRRCGYQLTGSTAATCSECGTQLSPRNRRIGRTRRRRLIVPLTLGSLMLLGAGNIFYHWYPPHDVSPWGAEGLPRSGAVSRWFHWPSQALYWCRWEGAFWNEWNNPDEHFTPYAQVLRVNVDTQQLSKPVIELEYDPLEFAHRVHWQIGDRFLLYGNEERTYTIDLRTGVARPYATLHDPGDLPILALSADEEYLVDAHDRSRLTAWNTATGAELIQFPAEHWRKNDRVIALNSVGGSRMIVALYNNDSPGAERRSHLWNPATGETRLAPSGIDLGFDAIAFTSDGGWIVSELRTFLWPGQPAFHSASSFDGEAENRLATDRFEWGEFRPVSIRNLRLVAIAKAAHTVYLFDIEANHWMAWDVRTKIARAIKEPAEQNVSTWIVEPALWHEPRMEITGDGDSIEVVRSFDQKVIEKIPTPVASHLHGATKDARFIVTEFEGLLGRGAVYDRQSRRWLGRWDASSNTSSGLYGEVHLVADRWIVVVIDDTPIKLLVYDLHKFVDSPAK